MRDQQTLQNILRFGRKRGETVIVLPTAVFPDWLPVRAQGSVTPWSRGMREVHSVWRDLCELTDTESTVVDIAAHDEVSVTNTRVRTILDRLDSELRLVTSRPNSDEGRQKLWSDTGLRTVDHLKTTEEDLTELSVEEAEEISLVGDDREINVEKAQISRYSINTSNLCIHPVRSLWVNSAIVLRFCRMPLSLGLLCEYLR